MTPTFVRCAVLALALAGPAAAQGPPRLGTVRFPSSGARAAQAPFLRGVLLLHSFEYRPALAAFREAQRADLGLRPRLLGRGHDLQPPSLGRAGRRLRPRGPGPPGADAGGATGPGADPRERGYLDAVELLYGEGDKPRRDTLYAEAMERLVARTRGTTRRRRSTRWH